MANEKRMLADLSMARKRAEKVYITDIAIEKVPYVRYKCIPESEYDTLHTIAQDVLRISKERNNSNEVAIVYSLESERLVREGREFIGVSIGDEVSVNPTESTTAYHIVHSTLDCAVICFHNHPNLSKLSLDDIKFFLRNESVKLLAAVTNLGAVSYIVKTERYDWNKARNLFTEAVIKQHEAHNLKELQDAAEYFLKNCYKANIIYEY